MWSSDDIVVDPTKVRAHATAVESTLGTVGDAKQAADYLARVDDGYGWLVGLYADRLVGSLHDRITDSLREIVETTEQLPKTLRYCADTFEDLDAGRKAELEGRQDQIE